MLSEKDLKYNNVKKSFCILPWIHSFVNLGGEHQICCTGEEFDNYIVDEQGKKLKVQDGVSIEEVMNSKFMKEFRMKLLRGEKVEACTRCFVTERNNGFSRRQTENDQYQYLINDVLDNTQLDGTIDAKIVHADYRLGNICNLKCRMCHPKASKKWIKEFSQISHELLNPNFVKDLDSFRNLNWFDTPEFDHDFSAKVATLNRLHFGGGEPLYNPKMLAMLRVCVEMGQSKNITLSYNTNLTILTDEILNLWKEFKDVKLLVSIDGYGIVNDYIRYPSNWDSVDRNLKLLDEKHKDYNVSEVIISSTVQMNNILHLDKLCNYLEKFDFIVKCPNLVSLYFPSYLSVKALPKPLRMIARLKIVQLIERMKKVSETQEFMIQNLEGIANSLTQIDPNQDKLLELFFQFTKEYDLNNKLSLFSVNPEFSKFIPE